MMSRRIGSAVLIVGVGAVVLSIAIGSGGAFMAGIALAGLGAILFAATGPQPLSGSVGRAGLLALSVGLLGFMAVSLAVVLYPASPPLDLLLLVGVMVTVVLTAIGCLVTLGSAVGMLVRPRRDGSVPHRMARGFVTLGAGLVLTGMTGYTVYVGSIGSDQLTHPAPITDCRTPDVRYGWSYEAINYDIADDAALKGSNPDMTKCSSQGATAGAQVVTSDGVPIAGWYIAAADGAGPTRTTVILVHGWDANKSEVLKYAPSLHAHYNVVAMDLRNGGRSGRVDTTFGPREKLDLEAMIDWLVRTKHPAHIAVMGNSMGGGTAALTAADDPRIEALILDSTHAHVSDIITRRLEVDAGHPALPGMPAILAGIWLRTGIDLMEADTVGAIPALGHRPLLLVHGAADIHDLPDRSVNVVYRVARDAGVPVELHLCPGATHGQVVDTCPDLWGQWVVTFLEQTFGPTS